MLISVHLTGKYNDQVFEDRDVQFSLGEGEEEGVIYGVEKALESFKEGECSKLKIKSKHAFKSAGKPEFNVPADADVEYTVELKNFDKLETWSLDLPEKIKQGTLIKERGTTYFKAGKYTLAIKLYKKVVEIVENKDFKVKKRSKTNFISNYQKIIIIFLSFFFKNEDDELDAKRVEILISAHLNLALCYLKVDENLEAKNSCDKVLEMRDDNEKALFRRGQAQLALGSPEIAIKDFQRVLVIEPKNSAAQKQINLCQEQMKKQLDKEKKLYGNMFEKFAKADRQVG